MEDKDLILAIDNGTQSLKALIFDLKGRLLFKKKGSVQTLFFRTTGLGRAGSSSFLAGPL